MYFFWTLCNFHKNKALPSNITQLAKGHRGLWLKSSFSVAMLEKMQPHAAKKIGLMDGINHFQCIISAPRGVVVCTMQIDHYGSYLIDCLINFQLVDL